MTDSPLERYRARCASGELTRDPAQEAATVRLDRLARALGRRRPGPLARFFRRAGPRERPRGVYLHGDVGRGKSLLMDLFFDCVADVPKARVHFHAFMQDVHRAMQARRRAGPDGRDTIAAVAAQVSGGSTLLCFDEFHVVDIADAMILGRLFERVLSLGIVVVATSNQHPRDLYEGGINRQLFLPFIDMLERELDIVAVDAEQDYRTAFLAQAGLYHSPDDERARRALDETFAHLVGEAEVGPARIDVQGRVFDVPRQARHVARFSFEELCARPLGSADYLALADAFHTVVIDGIPRLGGERRNEARRFTTLVDILYESATGLVCSAAAPPERLWETAGDAAAYARTASRLLEMQSAAWLERREAGGRDLPGRRAEA